MVCGTFLSFLLGLANKKCFHGMAKRTCKETKTEPEVGDSYEKIRITGDFDIFSCMSLTLALINL